MDNVLLASVLFNDHHKETIIRRCVMKIDISKAFDFVQWSFVLQSLDAIGVPDRFIHWIKLCIPLLHSQYELMGSLQGISKVKED